MHTFHDIDLFPYNTMKLHSIAKTMFCPESEEELFEIILDLKRKGSSFVCLSAGSNIVFNEIVHTPIINLMKVNVSLNKREDGIVRCGASVRIQNLIRFSQQYQLGGIEYLFSVPASVGGAVFMNA